MSINLSGWVQARRGVLEHLQDGRMTPNEFAVFHILLYLADKETGSYLINAKAIAFWTNGTINEDTPADREQKARLCKLSPDQVTATELAGEPITAKLTAAPGNGAPLGGLKVTTANAWFAARPSGTEDVYKIYAESFNGPEHLAEVQKTAREVVNQVIG